ncbi:hypothetical protein GH5_08501 [Leishmania sp. Ghana 2012 LV757]|uniref:hypothetical protein n=1 Tax=Leishmania sp. Ghana 2012 LV757 TaxID=2803181 RepID=UPI001B4C8611|nr:hypothetical protein GH5_08501 [Leishmania sp. Ghana 2012 LV757]
MAPSLARITTVAVARSSVGVPFTAALCRRHLAATITCASLRSTRTTAAVAGTATVASPSSALVCCDRTFYDKIRERRDGSDEEGPAGMFQDLPKGPNRQRVPAAFHKSNKDAVDSAEKLNGVFCVLLILSFGAIIRLLNPFQSDPYDRPDGYGWTEPRMVCGSSDLVHGRSSGGGGGGAREEVLGIKRLL